MAVSFDIAMKNLSDASTAIHALVAAAAYIIGIYLVARGVMMYKIFGSQTMASAQKGEFAGPLVFIIVGAVLIYLPSTQETTLMSIFGSEKAGSNSDLVAWMLPSAEQKFADLADVLISYMKLIGFIAFVRGFVILSKMGHSGSQPGSIGKGITHVIGGALLMNIPDFMKLLANTFGYQ